MLWEMFHLQLTESNSVHEWSPDLHWEGQQVAGLWTERGDGPRGPGEPVGVDEHQLYLHHRLTVCVQVWLTGSSWTKYI